MSEPATARQSHASLSSDLGFQNILGRSPAISEALALAHRVASSPRTTVLLLGETGAGKELFARGIHYAGPNSEQPFVAVNCDERLLRIRAGIVNTAREQLFSGAGFAQQQHRRARRARDAMSQGEGLGNRRAAPEDVLKAKVGRQRRV